MPYQEVSGITLHVFHDGGQLQCSAHYICVNITMVCSCHSDRLFVDQVKWKEPLILSLDFDKKVLIRSNVRIFNLPRPKKIRKAEKFWQLFGNFSKKLATFWQLLDTLFGNFFGIHRQLVAKPKDRGCSGGKGNRKRGNPETIIRNLKSEIGIRDQNPELTVEIIHFSNI